MMEPSAPLQESAAPTPLPAPAYTSTPALTPSVYESKPGRNQKLPGATLRAWILTSLLVFLVLIVILYFWGAHLAAQGA